VTWAFAGIAVAPALALGSFLNVVAARVPLRRSVVKPRSTCMSCGVPISGRDNIPLLSWALLRGRCRSCGSKIPVRYPLVELATAVLVAGCILKFGVSGRALVAVLFCCALVAITATDLEHRIIPNRIVVPAAVVILALQTAIDPSVEWAVAALAAFAFLFLTAIIYPAGMGMGDVKLAFLMGAALGRTVGVGLLVGMFAAMVPAAILLARHGSKARKMGIPFGPFLALGSIVALFAGHALLNAYLVAMG
jgi:leader peptidase (prepilin peptidase)/N-methyltransferase